MSKKTRNYFATGPLGAAGTKFRKGNLPTDEEFQNLRDSTPFFLEASDGATLTQRGLIFKADDDEVLDPSSVFGRNDSIGSAKAVVPRQLPRVTVGANVGDVSSSSVFQANGMKLVEWTETSSSGNKRKGYDLRFDPSTLPKISVMTGKSLVVYDETSHISYLFNSNYLFDGMKLNDDKNAYTAAGLPIESVSEIKLSGGKVTSTDTSSTYMTVQAATKSGKGQGLMLAAGKSTNNDAGGDIFLVAGQSDYSTGGGLVSISGGRSLGALGGAVTINGGQGFTGNGGVNIATSYGAITMGNVQGSTNPTAEPSTHGLVYNGNATFKGSLSLVSLFASKGIVIGDSSLALPGAIRYKDAGIQFYKESVGWTDIADGGSDLGVQIDDTQTSTSGAWSSSYISSLLSAKASSSHNHDLLYLPLGGTAVNSSLLEGHNAAYFATQTDIESIMSAAALGIKYTWADTSARDAQTGHAIGEMGIIESITNRPVYRATSTAAGSGSWELAFYMDASHTHAYLSLTGLPSIPTTLISLAESSLSRHLTDTQIGLWDAKADASSVYTKTAADALLATKAVINDAVTNTTNAWSSTKISTELGGKSDTTHVHDADDVSETANRKWLTPTQIANWDAAAGSGFDGAYSSLTGTPTIPTTLIELAEGSTSRHLTDAQIAIWDAKPVINDATVTSTSLWSSTKISSELSGKSATGHTHTADNISETSLRKWLTPTQISRWDAAAGAGFDGYYSSLIDPPTIPSALSDLSADSTSRHLTDTMISTWNSLPVIDDAVVALTSLWSSSKLYDLLSLKSATTHTHAYSTITGLPDIPTVLSGFGEDSTSRHLTDTMIGTWNAKSDFDGDYDSLTSKPIERQGTYLRNEAYKYLLVRSADNEEEEAYSHVDIDGSLGLAPASKNTSSDLDLDDKAVIYFLTSGTGSGVVNVPEASASHRRFYIVINGSGQASSFVMTIGDTINGSALELPFPTASVAFVSCTSPGNWNIAVVAQ